MRSIFDKIQRKLLHLRLRPIRVFCFHEVSETDENSPDWVPISFFKEQIMEYKNAGYEFITLAEAHRHISKDIFRRHKYAVLTADDGLRCQLELLPWLQEQNIPVTLSLNVKSLKQKECGAPYREWYHIQDPSTEKRYAEKLYISEKELSELQLDNVSVALHGVDHDKAATDVTIEEFEQDVIECLKVFSKNKHYTPFYVYKYGKHNNITDELLKKYGLTPVLSDGEKNYNDSNVVHREILETIYRKICQ